MTESKDELQLRTCSYTAFRRWESGRLRNISTACWNDEWSSPRTVVLIHAPFLGLDRGVAGMECLGTWTEDPLTYP